LIDFPEWMTGMRQVKAASSGSRAYRNGAAGETRKSKHREVFDTLLGEITSGRFRPGDRMPTEAELSKVFSASRATIARAMRELKARGLLVRQRGGGTHIAKPANTARIAFFTPFANTVSQLGPIESRLFAQLSELASQRSDDLRIQFLGRRGENQLEQMLSAVEEMKEKGVNGLLYCPANVTSEFAEYHKIVVEKIQAAGVPLVLVDRDIVPFPRRSNLPLVSYDYRRSGYLVANHLLQNGRRRIAFVATPGMSDPVIDRINGCVDAVVAHNLPRQANWVQPAREDDLTTQFCERLMEQTNPDAIVCEVDHVAATVGRHLVEIGVKIGQDVALAGFFDEPIAAALPVPLTTVRFPIEPLAIVCYERLLKLMANPALPDTGRTLIDVELIVRTSSAPTRFGTKVERPGTKADR
jgi:DNA-binding LacI/PurR family transcriptional regulator